MRILISATDKGPRELLLHQKVANHLRGMGVNVVTAEEMRERHTGDATFASIDGFIIDGTTLESDNGYLIAIALANKKPVLYLVEKGNVLDSSVDALTKNKDVKKYLKIGFFTPDSIITRVKVFLQFLGQTAGREAYSVKYTLRLSPRMDRYLKWKADKVHKNKADFLRDMLEDITKSDKEYPY